MRFAVTTSLHNYLLGYCRYRKKGFMFEICEKINYIHSVRPQQAALSPTTTNHLARTRVSLTQLSHP